MTSNDLSLCFVFAEKIRQSAVAAADSEPNKVAAAIAADALAADETAVVDAAANDAYGPDGQLISRGHDWRDQN